MDSQVEEIKQKLNILDVIGGYLKLTKTGINYRGVCPFHAEKTPSFFVSPTRQMWHCFGCGSGSSLFDFIMKIEGVEFGDALRILANKAGIVLKRENVQLRTQRQKLYEICELACKFFEKQLESGVGKEAESYLLSRGITKDSIKKWRVGYSPDTWNGLTDFLIGNGYQREEVVKAGLAIKKENSSDSYDRFRGRIMFPVFDLNSAVIGFGGRVFSAKGGSASGGKHFDAIAKYINTPQTLLYDKSGVLYGLHAAKVAIRKQNQCVVTEGYTDVIMCHQAGFENTVASSGTALTERHLDVLKRYSENLVLAFDMDIAGDSATKRGIHLAEEKGFNIKIVEHYGSNDKKYDPADIIKENPKIWEESIQKSKGIMDYYFDSAFLRFDKNSPSGKKDIGNILLPAIKRLQNAIEQSHWVQKLSSLLGVKEEVLLQEMAKFRTYVVRETVEYQPVASNKAPEKERKRLIEEKIISLVLKNPDDIALISEQQLTLFSETMRGFIEHIRNIVGEQSKTAEGQIIQDFKAIFEERGNAELKNFMAALALKADADYQEDGQEEVKLCLAELKNVHLKDTLNKISGEIKQAELIHNDEKVVTLMEEFNKLTKEL